MQNCIKIILNRQIMKQMSRVTKVEPVLPNLCGENSSILVKISNFGRFVPIKKWNDATAHIPSTQPYCRVCVCVLGRGDQTASEKECGFAHSHRGHIKKTLKLFSLTHL